MSALDAARVLLERGYAPIPIPHQKKAPVISGWPELFVTDANLSQYFNGQPMNIGVLLGQPGNGVMDVDLDCQEAILAASYLLPTTGAVFGRKSKPSSHWLYRCDCPTKTQQFKDTDGSCLAEIRGTGVQTVVPPSTHPSGELIQWERDGKPAQVDCDDLLIRVKRIAAAALLARHWPEKGGRHEAALALAGGLRHAWTEQQAARFVEAVAMAAGDPEVRDRVAAVATTYEHEADDAITGWKRLSERIGEDVVRQAREWLGIQARPALVVEHTSAIAEPEWPSPPSDEAFYGLAGDYVRLVDPHTESDPVAVLVQMLVFFGNVVGRNRYCRAEADFHFPNLFAVLVGQTAKGRKGTSVGHVRRLFASVDPEWARTRVKSGSSSGEGYIWNVRDAVTKQADGKEKTVDEGETDKRLLVMESEFATILRNVARTGNILSAIIRDAWDRGNLNTLVSGRNQAPVAATDAHISIVGHITADELKRNLTETEAANGFGNRFLWICVRRSKYLPDGGSLQDSDLDPIRERLLRAVEFARKPGLVARNDTAAQMWRAAYRKLEADHPGMMGAMTSRAGAQVLRLSLIYALMDCSDTIQQEHLLAAFALWEYVEGSARYLFGAATGDPVADTILRGLRGSPEGLNRTEIHTLLGRNQTAARIEVALELLTSYGLAVCETVKGDGDARSVERWRYPFSRR